MKLFWISIVTVRELLFERVFYVLLAFATLAVALSLALGQLTYSDQAKLSLDFMLAGTQLSMVLFSIFVGVSLFQREIMLGSVAMILSKPVSRASFLVGKFTGQLFVQFGVITLMLFLTLAAYSGEQSGAMGTTLGISQSFFLTFLEAAVLASITYWLASFCGPITTGTIAIALFFLGHFRKTFEATVTGSIVWAVFEKAIPNLEFFNLKTLATYGFVLKWDELAWISAYSVVCTSMFLLLAIVCFNERDIPT